MSDLDQTVLPAVPHRARPVQHGFVARVAGGLFMG
ncbi:phosphonate ABC transporter permease, partial [Rhizobium leguminosarum]|nr:phosphonate ABC transporter permease [Rhizobium leguminosarum]